MADPLELVSGIQQAKDAGYTPDEIYGHLVQQPEFAKAKDAGYSFDEVYQHIYSGAQRKAVAMQESALGAGSPVGSQLAMLRGDLKIDPLPGFAREILDQLPPEAEKKVADTVKSQPQEVWEKEVGPVMASQLKQHYAQRVQGVSDEDQPIFYLPKPGGDGAAASLARGAEQSLEGLVTLKNIGILGASMMLPKPLQHVVGKGFLAMMAKGVVDEGSTVLDPNATQSEKMEAWGRGLTGAALVGLGAKGEFGRPAEGAPVSDRAAARGVTPQDLRKGGMTQEQADAAATQNQLRALAPETTAVADPKPKGDSEILDGMTLARKKLVEGFSEAPPGQQKVRQVIIDHIDDVLLKHDKEAVTASEERIKSQADTPPTEAAPAGNTAEVPSPPTQGGRSPVFTQALREQGAPLTAEVVDNLPVGEPPTPPVAEGDKPSGDEVPTEATGSPAEKPGQGRMSGADAHDFQEWARGKTVGELRQLRSDHEAEPGPKSDHAIEIINATIAEKSKSLKATVELPKPSPIVGPAMLSDGGIVAKGEIGQKHADLIKNAVSKGNVDAITGEHGFHDEEGKPLTRTVAADRALKTGQIDQATFDKAMARPEGPDRGLHSEDLMKGGDSVEKENAQKVQEKEVTPPSTSEPATVQPGEQVSPGAKLAEGLQKLGRVNRDPAEAVARELKYYSDEERQQLQDHLGTADANPDTLAKAITGKSKIKETSRPSDYIDEPGGKEGRGHPTADVAKEAFGEDYTGGPGAMGPREAEAMRSAQTATGLKKATALVERLARGEEPLPEAERQSETEAVQRAVETQDRTPNAARDLVARILDQGDTAISRDDAALLLVERNRVLEDMRQADARLSNETALPLERAEAQGQLKDLETQIDRLDRAQKEAGSQWGRVGRMYQRMIREDYSLEGIQRKMRTAKGGPLDEGERAQAEQAAAKMDEAMKVRDAAEVARTAEQEKEDLNYFYEQTVKDLQKEVAKAPKISKPILDVARGIVDKLNTRADAARVRLRERLSRTSAGVDPTIVLDVAEIMAAHIGEIGLKSAEVSARVLSEFGDSVKPYLSKAWEQARKMIDGLSEKAEAKAAVKKGIGTKEKTTTDIAAKAKAEAKAGEGLSNNTVYELARAHIKAGVHGEDAVMAAVHKDIKEAYPGATERDVRRAFSDYGKTKFPSQEAVAKELRELRTLTRLQESIDRLKEGQDALKTGPQRDKATQEIRAKQKQLDELLKTRQGPPSPEKLASQEEAKITALQNRIADIDKELKTGERPPESAPLPDSPAVEQLKAERDAMQEKLNEIRDAQKPKPTAEEIEADRAQQAVARAAAALDRQQRINNGEITPEAKEKAQPLSALEKELQDRTEELRDAKRKADAQKTPEDVAADKAQKGVDAAAAALDRWDRIAKGELTPDPTDTKEPGSNLEEELRAQTEAIKEAVRESNKKPTDEQARQIKALEKATEEYKRRAAAGEIEGKGKVQNRPDLELVAKAREARDAAKKILDDLRKTSKPVKTPEERYNETRMKGVRKQIADLEERLKTGNFEKTKPTPLKKTAEVAAAEAKLTEVRREVDKAIEKKKYEQLSPQQRLFKEVMSTFHSITALKILGHGSVGMITHAGGLIFRPTRATIYWKNFGRQFGMWHDKAYHDQLIYRLKNDPEFETWKKAGASIDPEKTYTDYGMYAQWLGKLGEKGARGFDALKLVRMEMNKADWTRVPDEIKNDPKQADAARKLIAEINNKATGATPKTNPMGKTLEEGFYNVTKNPVLEAAFFAPRLYASRWGRVLFDPVKTARTLFDPQSSPAEQFAAKTKLKNAAEFTGTLVAALLTNQAILSATGSKQNVNLTDPTKSDWLKFKAGDKTLTADGGLLDPVRLLGQVIWKDLLADRTAQQQYREGSRYKKAVDTVGSYLRGKLNPPVGLAADLATGSDFQGRPLPWNKEKPQFKGQSPYSYGEYLVSQGPIPMAGAAKEIAADLQAKGFKDREIQVILKAIATFGLGMAGVNVGEDYSTQPKSSGGGPSVKLKRR